MNQKLKQILSGLLILVCSMVGLWEYMQLFLFFDVPQALVVLPVAGCVAAALLGKYSFVVPAASAALSIVYQMAEQNANFLGVVGETKSQILIGILPFVVLFILLGIGGGLLIRVLIQGKKSKITGIICCVLGILITFGGGVFLFHNPLYPFTARHAITSYAQKYQTENYPLSDVVVYFSLENLEYEGRAVMSDGAVHAIYHDKNTGEVYGIDR